MSDISLSGYPAEPNRTRLFLAVALLGIAATLLLYRPFATASGIKRQLLPEEAAELGLVRYSSLGIDAASSSVTVLAVEDKDLLLFVRDRLGAEAGNARLSESVPAAFWEIGLHGPSQHITTLDWRTSSAGRISDWNEVDQSLLKIDERGNWFQFYRRPSNPESAPPLTHKEAVSISRNFLYNHALLLPNTREPFNPASEPSQVIHDRPNYHRVYWNIDSGIPDLETVVAVELSGAEVVYAGLEFNLPESYRTARPLVWRASFLLRVILIAGGLMIAFVMIIKQLRRDAIDFQFSFSYSALLTFPVIAIVIADLPTLVDEGYSSSVVENFYLLSSSTFLWLILLLLTIPLVALNDSLVRQRWPDKINTFDSLLRGNFRLRPVGRAVLQGLCVGLGALGVTSILNAALVGYGGYTHRIFITPLSGSVAFVWATFCAFGQSLVLGFVALFTATLISLKFRNRYAAGLTGLVWLILLVSTSERYSSLLNFAAFALVHAGVIVYLIYKRDLLTLITAHFSSLLCLAGAEMVFLGGRVYLLNGLAVFAILGAIAYASKRIADGEQSIPVVDYVPKYIEKLKKRERIERDIEIARELQFQFLPQQLPAHNLFEIATLFNPAHEVGGDYYDFVELGSGRLGIVIADVSGKGIPAAFYMTMVKGIVQTQVHQEDTPADLLKQINRVVYKCTGSNIFITLFYAIIDAEQGTLTYSNAGHNPPLLISQNGFTRELDRGGMVLGVMPKPAYEEETVNLFQGDRLLLFTDGVIETTNMLGEEFGTERLITILKQSSSTPAKTIDAISRELATFSAGTPQADDTTMIIVSFSA